MITYTAKIFDIDFYGNTIGEPLKIVSGEYASEKDALDQISEEFHNHGEYEGNFKVELI